MTGNSLEPVEQTWSEWEHDDDELDLFIRHRRVADGGTESDYLDLRYLNTLESRARRYRKALEQIESLSRAKIRNATQQQLFINATKLATEALKDG